MNAHSDSFELAAAGLLHDIGKVLQPAGFALFPGADGLEPMICPVRDGRYSHRHVLYTAHALHATSSNFGKMDRSRIERVAIHHHRPSSGQLDEHILTKADWLASGHDRESTQEEVERTGLAPIVSALTWPDTGWKLNEIDQWVVPTGELEFGELLPRPKPAMENYRVQCRVLSDRLLAGLNRDYADRQTCIEGLLALLQRLLHSIPASRYRGHVPDVSLFDHSRVVAAIAACLVRLPHPEAVDANRIHGRFRFVSLGVGGIQNFIFHSIPALEPGVTEGAEGASKGNAKRLRARSFYLSAYSWVAARRILQAADLPSTNLIYDAGGHALLLLPDDEPTIDSVRRQLDQIARSIRDDLGGGLRFDFAVSVPLGDQHFHREQFQRVLRELEAERAASRFRFPDSRLLNESGWSAAGWVADASPSLPIDRGDFLNRMRNLGNALPKVRYLALDCGDHGDWAGEILGTRVSLHADRPRSGNVFALTLNSDDLTTPLFLSGSHLPTAGRDDVIRLRDNRSETDPSDQTGVGDTLTFTDLAKLSTNDDGTPVRHEMLGIFKADVDLLGSLISYGFTNASMSPSGDELAGNRATIGRLAALSRSIDQFFKGFVTEKLRAEYHHLYTVFVGGDDLFLIGPWYDVVRFARKLHCWFTDMTCGNPNVTFSAGIAFTKPTTPVRRLASLAEESLDSAKSNGRNRIGLGRVTLSWEQFHQSLTLHRLLLDCSRPSESTRRAKVNPSLTYRLLQYAKQALRCGEFSRDPLSANRPSFADMKWRAQMSYDLKRNLPLRKDEDQILIELHSALLQIDATNAAVLYAAATLSLYFLRGERE